jgi:hypothetical protein
MPPQALNAQLSFQVCPILLTGGIASQIPQGVLPMLSLFGGSPPGQPSAALGLPFDIGDLDNAFGAFNVLPGGTLVAQSISKYPFANQWVAANAVIREPITVSVIMDAPMRPMPTVYPGVDVWKIKMAVFTALKSTLDQHNNAGGTYIVATPAYIYDYLIMTALTDNSRGNNSLPQNAWRFDFERPLSALTELAAAQQNSITSKITAQVPPTTVAPSGVQVGQIGSNPTLALTAKVAGSLSGWGPSLAGGGVTQEASNFPALPNPSNFPFVGIS